MNKARRERIDRRNALKLWGINVRLRDNNTCQICGSTKFLNAHHIIPKEIKELSLDIMNGETLCVKCHKFGLFSAHKNGLWFSEFLKTKKPRQYAYLLKKIQGGL